MNRMEVEVETELEEGPGVYESFIQVEGSYNWSPYLTFPEGLTMDDVVTRITKMVKLNHLGTNIIYIRIKKITEIRKVEISFSDKETK